MHTLKSLGLAGVLLAALTASSWADETRDEKKPGEDNQDRRPSIRNREGNLKVGDLAPIFAVKDMHGKQDVRLSDLKGKPVVLIFGSCT